MKRTRAALTSNDTETTYNDIHEGILQKYGKALTLEARLDIAGSVEQDVSSALVQRFELPISPQEYEGEAAEAVRELLGRPPLKPGAERLIRHLARHVPLALATSSGEDSFGIKTSQYSELFGLFHHVVLGSSDPEVVLGKPAPDIFLLAAARFPADPKKCLVLEDSPNGVRAAKAAGMQVVMIPEEYVPEDQRQDATLVLSSMEEFEPMIFGLPGYT